MPSSLGRKNAHHLRTPGRRRLHHRQLPGRSIHQTGHPTLTQDRRSQPRARQARQVPDRRRTHHHRLHRRRDGGTHQRGPTPSPHGSRQRPPRARIRQVSTTLPAAPTQALPISHTPPAQLRLPRQHLISRHNPERPDRPRHRRPRPHQRHPRRHTITQPARPRHRRTHSHPTTPDTDTDTTHQPTAHDDTTPIPARHTQS